MDMTKVKTAAVGGATIPVAWEGGCAPTVVKSRITYRGEVKLLSTDGRVVDIRIVDPAKRREYKGKFSARK